MATRLPGFFRLFLLTGILLVVPFVINTVKAAAAPMRAHATNGIMQTDCATICARTGNIPQPQAVLQHEEIRTPDPTPEPYESYYLQFQMNYVPKPLRPSAVFGAYPIRPPDILKLSGNYRF